MTVSSPASATRQLRVAQVVETVTVGGAENLAIRIANALPEQGFASHLIVITEPGELSDRIEEEVKVHYLHFKRASITNPFGFGWSIFQGYRRMVGLLKRESIDLVQTHLPGANFWGLLLQLGKACQVFATIHNNQEFHYGDADNPWRARLRRWAYRLIVNRCTGTIAVSAQVKSSLAADLGLSSEAQSRIAVVPNGVEVPPTLSASEIVEVRRALGLDPLLPLILAAGRFGPQKNFSDLVDIAAELANRGVAFQMVIAGDGEQREEIHLRVKKSGLAGKVILPGNLSNLGQVMLAADIFVMTSRWEGLPLVLLEAMAAGLPAVAYEIPGVVELVHEGHNGHVVPIGSQSEFALQVENLLNSSAMRLELGNHGRDRILRDFHFRGVILKLSGHYSRAIDE